MARLFVAAPENAGAGGVRNVPPRKRGMAWSAGLRQSHVFKKKRRSRHSTPGGFGLARPHIPLSRGFFELPERQGPAPASAPAFLKGGRRSLGGLAFVPLRRTRVSMYSRAFEGFFLRAVTSQGDANAGSFPCRRRSTASLMGRNAYQYGGGFKRGDKFFSTAGACAEPVDFFETGRGIGLC